MSNSSLFSFPTLSLLLWITATSQAAALISKLHTDGQQHCANFLASSNTASQFDESLAEFASISFPVNLTKHGGDDWAAGYCTSTYVAETGRETSTPSGPSNKVTIAYLCLNATVDASSKCYCIGRLGDYVCDHCQAANKTLAPSFDNFWASCLDGRSGIDCTIHHDFEPGFLFGWCDAPPDVTTTPTPAPTPTPSSKDRRKPPHNTSPAAVGIRSTHVGATTSITLVVTVSIFLFSVVQIVHHVDGETMHNPLRSVFIFLKAMCPVPAVSVQRKPHRRRQVTDPDR